MRQAAGMQELRRDVIGAQARWRDICLPGPGLLVEVSKGAVGLPRLWNHSRRSSYNAYGDLTLTLTLAPTLTLTQTQTRARTRTRTRTLALALTLTQPGLAMQIYHSTFIGTGAAAWPKCPAPTRCIPKCPVPARCRAQVPRAHSLYGQVPRADPLY